MPPWDPALGQTSQERLSRSLVRHCPNASIPSVYLTSPHMTRSLRPFSSVYAYWRWWKTAWRWEWPGNEAIPSSFVGMLQWYVHNWGIKELRVRHETLFWKLSLPYQWVIPATRSGITSRDVYFMCTADLCAGVASQLGTTAGHSNSWTTPQSSTCYNSTAKLELTWKQVNLMHGSSSAGTR